jgi:YHS domain-containing protein
MKKIIMSALMFTVFAVFINLSYSQSDDVNNPDATNTEVAPSGDICPVSGESIAPGDGVEYSYLGTTYKFCCKNCVKKFKAEPMKYIGELKCPVSGESASKDVNTVVDGVKYYFCSSNCKEEFEKNPEKYLNNNINEDSK